MAIASETIEVQARRAQDASRELALAGSELKNKALTEVAALLREHTGEVLEANRLDVEAGRESGMEAALLDRLSLDESRVEDMAAGVEAVAELPDPVGEVLDRRTLRSGIELEQIRVPLGVIAIIYEARPNVTVDTAALCLKSGNACVLRGSRSADRSNAVLAAIVREGIGRAGLPESSVESIPAGGREQLAELATMEGVIDLVVPRGGEGLKEALKSVATVPVLYAGGGNCHVFVDEAADLEMARAVAYNSKVQRPGVCNAAETLLVHEAVAQQFLPGIVADFEAAGVELVGDETVREIAGPGAVGEATAADWDTEYHGLKMAIGVVDSVEEAIQHINAHGTSHSEAIITESEAAADRFTGGVDAACVYVNASTRFTDGFEFGMGAEIGNSTQKLHARGPIGLRELTTIKYVLRGTGQTRG